MEFLRDNPIKNFVKDEIIDKLGNFKGYDEKIDISNLYCDLFEAESQDGNYFENDETAKKFIYDNFEYLREIFEHFKNEYNCDYVNNILLDIFDNPNNVVVIIILEVARCILFECAKVLKLWEKEDEIVLTDELIDKLMAEVKKI